jgi:hypothetical protein
MEPDDWGFHAPLPSVGNKRHLSVDGDDALRDSKKNCMQPLEFSLGYGTALDSGPALANLSADFPVQSIGAQTHHPTFWSSSETLIDVSAFPTVTPTHLELTVSRAVIHPVHSTLISSPQLIILARKKPD